MEITYTHTGKRGRPKSNLPEAYLKKVSSMSSGESYMMPTAHKNYFMDACRELGLNFKFRKEGVSPGSMIGSVYAPGEVVAGERFASIKVDSDIPIPETRIDTLENLVYGLKVGQSFEIQNSMKYEVFDVFKRFKFQYTSQVERQENEVTFVRIWRIK